MINEIAIDRWMIASPVLYTCRQCRLQCSSYSDKIYSEVIGEPCTIRTSLKKVVFSFSLRARPPADNPSFASTHKIVCLSK